MSVSQSYTPTVYAAKDYSAIKGLHGITDEQIEVHLKLYNGYVNRTNALLAKVAKMANDGQHGDSSYQELKRRAGWEWNGMRLHEYYFDNLGSSGSFTPDANQFVARVAGLFGSADAWKADLMGTAKMPGVGWAITYLDTPPARSGTTGSPPTRKATPPAPSRCWSSTCGSTPSRSTASPPTAPRTSRTSSPTSAGTPSPSASTPHPQARGSAANARVCGNTRRSDRGHTRATGPAKKERVRPSAATPSLTSASLNKEP
jgi:hypothetical protein